MLILGVLAAVLRHGIRRAPHAVRVDLGLFLIVAAVFLTVSLALRFRWSLARKTFLRSNRLPILTSLLWSGAMLVTLVFAPLLSLGGGGGLSRFDAFVAVSEAAILLRGATGTILVVRRSTAGATDPAVILVGSFLVLIAVGTGLLMLPRAVASEARAEDSADSRFVVALFTATSASCVTGLVVENTGTYWSPFGQTVIFGLFQVGGLGIMTCGAFFALAAGRGMQIRESATLRDMLESEQLGDVRRLVLTILMFTIGSELVGAVLISGLWDHLPLGEQIRYSVFHSVSAFCNAGFSLTENSLSGRGDRWQVWGGFAGLIILGGMGFSVLYNLALSLRSRIGRIKSTPLFHLPRTRVRLSLTTRLALATSVSLLLAGTVGYYVLENASASAAEGTTSPLADAWFQSVTFRTAGFNTVNQREMQPGTKLLAILLMFVGASPGSTGGGVKTVCFAITVLALVSILRGRDRVEIAGRTIPQDLVNRALVIMALGIAVVMLTTLLLVVFEDQPDRFLDHLFEATSAFATVGVSAGVTPTLSTPSRIAIIVTMFVGRVGPLTLLIAMTGRTQPARYDYPAERVTLG